MKRNLWFGHIPKQAKPAPSSGQKGRQSLADVTPSSGALPIHLREANPSSLHPLSKTAGPGSPATRCYISSPLPADTSCAHHHSIQPRGGYLLPVMLFILILPLRYLSQRLLSACPASRFQRPFGSLPNRSTSCALFLRPGAGFREGPSRAFSRTIAIQPDFDGLPQ